MTSATSTRLAAAALAGLAVVLIAGCWSRSSREVIVYTALDSEFSEPIFADFEASTGIKVLPKFDTESTKTVGLARALLAERDRWRSIQTPAGPIPSLLPPPVIAGYEPPMGAVPSLGEHTEKVLGELGFTDTEIAGLHDQGAIGQSGSR